ncbi:hypothetical protein ACFLYP_00365, partial [Chloroflexota bacterium]
QSRFLQLREEITNPQSLREAQTILIRCGAISYCLDHIFRRHEKVLQQLGAMEGLAEAANFLALVDELVEAPREILSQRGFEALEILGAY